MKRQPTPTAIYLAANQGAMGGGEVMLLRCAEAARSLGLDAWVVAPADPDETLEAAQAAGFGTVAIPGGSRRDYARSLRRWSRRARQGLLWCQGLLPALATAGHRDRIVHLHQLPTGRGQEVSYQLARRRSLAVVVPSHFMASRLSGSRVLPNWTDEVVPHSNTPRQPGDPLAIGFLGRLSADKGVDVLARAVGTVAQDRSLRAARPVVLHLAGDDRFVSGEQQRTVAVAVDRLGDRVVLRGWITREDFFADVDLAVVPSVWSEPFGLSAVEAMSARVPLLVSNAGALPEVVGADHPWVAPAGDADRLAELITAALDADGGPAVQRAHDRWQTTYSPEAGRRHVAELLTGLGLLEGEQS